MNTNNFSLDEWLTWISSLNDKEIILGLDRVKEVAQNLGLSQPLCPLIIVGGTNGKGSTVASLEKIYSCQGYRVGAFTSPILFRHNELLRMEGKEVEDHFFCEAYAEIEKARKKIPLTPFEFHTLAAFYLFSQQALDLWLLEVGLGGRLDAVNMMDADLAIVSSIGIDHVAYLGDTRELIGREKAGIFRSRKPVVCGDFDPPSSLEEEAKKQEAPFFSQGKNFSYSLEEKTWTWRSQKNSYAQLALSSLALQNISTALMAIELLQERMPVSEKAIREGIQTVSLPGRIEIHHQAVTEIRDVAHNPAAVAFLAKHLQTLPCSGKTRAVFSMLADKDLAGSLEAIKNDIDEWYVAPLTVKRGASEKELAQAFAQEKIKAVHYDASLLESYQRALKVSEKGDRLVVFGSFHTLKESCI